MSDHVCFRSVAPALSVWCGAGRPRHTRHDQTASYPILALRHGLSEDHRIGPDSLETVPSRFYAHDLGAGFVPWIDTQLTGCLPIGLCCVGHMSRDVRPCGFQYLPDVLPPRSLTTRSRAVMCATELATTHCGPSPVSPVAKTQRLIKRICTRHDQLLAVAAILLTTLPAVIAVPVGPLRSQRLSGS